MTFSHARSLPLLTLRLATNLRWLWNRSIAQRSADPHRHPAGRTLTSDWQLYNVCLWENILVVLWTENSNWIKNKISWTTITKLWTSQKWALFPYGPTPSSSFEGTGTLKIFSCIAITKLWTSEKWALFL